MVQACVFAVSSKNYHLLVASTLTESYQWKVCFLIKKKGTLTESDAKYTPVVFYSWKDTQSTFFYRGNVSG